MRKFVLIDAMNLFFRAAHVVSPSAGIDNMIGMGFHIMLNCMKKAYQDFNADHVIFCMEGRSWRKDVYPQYKANRKVAKEAMDPRDRENQEIMLEAYSDFCEFMKDKTNVTVLRNGIVEADDLIAYWIDSHPEDEHIIVSSDGDFLQLLQHNVKIYNGIDKAITTVDGVYNEDLSPKIDKKTKEHKIPSDPEYFLFMKAIRGDKSDNIFSAYPGAREKGTKNKVGIQEAFADRKEKGYSWNNFMNQRWTDHEGNDRLVKEEFERNMLLVDLRAQPDTIKAVCAQTIEEALDKPQVSGVGITLMRFCGKWALNRISDNAQDFARMLNAKYPN